MIFQALASGSNGNCSVFSNGEDAVLFDAGISRRRVLNGLDRLKIKHENMKYVFVTHAHGDHISGLPVLMSSLKNAKVVASQGTLDELHKLEKNDVRYTQVAKRAIPLSYFDPSDLTNFHVKMFPVEHDIGGSAGFSVQDINSEFNVCYTTDTASIQNEFIEEMQNSEIIFIESNHDEKLLRNSRRPLWLKRRIVETHLNNKQTVEILNKAVSEYTRAIFLGHLSGECNKISIPRNELLKFKEEKAHELNFEWIICSRHDESTLAMFNGETVLKGGINSKNLSDFDNSPLESYFS